MVAQAVEADLAAFNPAIGGLGKQGVPVKRNRFQIDHPSASAAAKMAMGFGIVVKAVGGIGQPQAF